MSDRKTTLDLADRALVHIEQTMGDASECEKRLARAYRLTRVSTEFSVPKYAPRTFSEKLGLLVEEAGEVLAAVGKTVRWGLASSNPDLPEEKRETNKEWLKRELRDLKRAIEIMEQTLDAEETP